MRILKIFAKALLGLLAAVCLAIGVARASLPRTACTVTEAQIASLELEKMSYGGVAAKFGCDGVLTSKEIYGSNSSSKTMPGRVTLGPMPGLRDISSIGNCTALRKRG